jgi:hypothetical protein
VFLDWHFAGAARIRKPHALERVALVCRSGMSVSRNICVRQIDAGQVCFAEN